MRIKARSNAASRKLPVLNVTAGRWRFMLKGANRGIPSEKRSRIRWLITPKYKPERMQRSHSL